jgi:ribonucleoside-diphosphate reductase alpha chain
MKILKRNGTYQDIHVQKVIDRISNISKDLEIDAVELGLKVIAFINDGVSSSILDEQTARIAIGYTENPDYAVLASRITISNLHKGTRNTTFRDTMQLIYEKCPVLFSEKFMETVLKFSDKLEARIDYSRDYLYDYFGYKALEKSFLTNIEGRIIERPQHWHMRVAVNLYKNYESTDILDKILNTYDLLSQHYYIHSSPTGFNSGYKLGCLSSCFLLQTQDSLEGIFKNITDCALISKYGGGISVGISDIRAKGSTIRSTNGTSDGIVPMLQVYDKTIRYANQSNKRNGSLAIYIEPWHADILSFLVLKRAQTEEKSRADGLFYALWIPDYFMRCLFEGKDWYLMCPDTCPGLSDAYGSDFDKLYEKYISEGKYTKKISPLDIWKLMIESQIERGVPYVGFKDAVNQKCNQKNLGTVKSSNLCSEISLVSSSTEYAVCNLCNVALPKFVKDGQFDFEALHSVTGTLVENMNRVIDENVYPVKEAEISDKKNRPLGIGVQGLHDVYIKMGYPYDSDEASRLNIEIFECLYHGLVTASIELAKVNGPYESFKGSPFSEGKLQFDLVAEYDNIDINKYFSGRYNWDAVRSDLKLYGIRNSMLTALMPTATSSVCLGNTESFEVINSCFFKRATLSGEFSIINKYLISDLQKLGLWSIDLKNQIIKNEGSIQSIKGIPENIKKLYKTVWETSMKAVINQCRDRGLFVDQMQSMNLYTKQASYNTISSMLRYSWEQRLKTGMYYLRSTSAASADKVTVPKGNKDELAKLQCSIDNKETCIMCE